MKKWLCVILAAAAVLAVFLIFHRPVPAFDGRRSKNADSYALDCQALNTQDEHTLSLQAGDLVHIQAQVQKGTLQATVGMAGQTPIYRSNGMETGVFEVAIPETGDYQITLKGSGFAGTVSFTAVPGE